MTILPLGLQSWERTIRAVELVKQRLLRATAAAEAMRRVLVNHARDRTRLKRGGGRNRVDLDNLTSPAAASDVDLLELDDALNRLAREFPAAAELVKMRFFAGMTLGEAAEAIGTPRRTADRHRAFARRKARIVHPRVRRTLGALGAK